MFHNPERAPGHHAAKPFVRQFALGCRHDGGVNDDYGLCHGVAGAVPGAQDTDRAGGLYRLYGMVCGPLDLATAVVCGGSGHSGARLGGFQAVPASAGLAAGPSLPGPLLRGHSARCGCLWCHERLHVVLRWRGRACVRHGPVRRWSAACQPPHAPCPTDSDFGCGTPRDLFPWPAGVQRNLEPELAGVADRDRLHPLYEPSGRDGEAEFFHHRGAQVRPPERR